MGDGGLKHSPLSRFRESDLRYAEKWKVWSILTAVCVCVRVQ